MNAIEHLLNQSWTARLGWTLVHFFWQGTLIAALFAAVRSLAGRRLAPEARYGLACLALASLAAAPALTFLAAGEPGPGSGFETAGRVAAAQWQRILPYLVPVWIAGVVAFPYGCWPDGAGPGGCGRWASVPWPQNGSGR